MEWNETPDGQKINPIITIDPAQSDIGDVLVHEALHHLLDSIYDSHVTYDIYEFWVAATEKRFWRGISLSEKERWFTFFRSTIMRSLREND